MKKRRLSLGARVNIFIVVIILTISSLVFISSNIAFNRSVFEPYEENLLAVQDPPEKIVRYLEYFSSIFGSEALEDARQYVDDPGERGFILWMDGYLAMDPEADKAAGQFPGLLNDWFNFYTYAEDILHRADLDLVSVDVVKNGITYMVCDCIWIADNEHSYNLFGQKGATFEQDPAEFEKPQYVKFEDQPQLIRCITVPLNNSQAHIWLSYEMDEYAEHARGYVLMSAFFIVMLTALAALISIWLVRRYITRPIRALARAARDFVPEEDGTYSSGRVSTLNYPEGDEIGELSRDIRAMQENIVENTADLMKVTADNERRSTELNMARGIQAGMLPGVFPPFPDRTEFDLYATMTPAREVGGDFYDFFLVDDDHLALVIADVSGKGVPGALFMAITKAILKNSVVLGKPVGESLETINGLICANNKLEMFITVWLGILEISTGRITAANAGHEYPALMQKGKFELLKDKHSFVIGGMEGMKYKEYELVLEPGDKLFLYTDGIPEAADTDNAMFGTDRMLETLNAGPGRSPEQLIEAVSDAVAEFAGQAEQYDDQTMLCLVYNGKK